MPAKIPKVSGEWREFAACKGKDVDLFFPERNQAKARKAKEICAKCPVKSECLEEAIRNRERFGIWGGMDQGERRREMRRRRKQQKQRKG